MAAQLEGSQGDCVHREPVRLEAGPCSTASTPTDPVSVLVFATLLLNAASASATCAFWTGSGLPRKWAWGSLAQATHLVLYFHEGLSTNNQHACHEEGVLCTRQAICKICFAALPRRSAPSHVCRPQTLALQKPLACDPC